MPFPQFRITWLIMAIASLPCLSVNAAESTATNDTRAATYSPNVGKSYPDHVYFGDTHLHTSYSVDAALNDNVLGPEEALRFASGQTVASSTGVPAKLIRPLDFLVVSDHAVALGLIQAINDHPKLTELLEQLGCDPEAGGDDDATSPEVESCPDSALIASIQEKIEAFFSSDASEGINPIPTKLTKKAWLDIVEAVRKYNKPGIFTAFHGYEWTSNPEFNNLHRVVIFRDGEDKVSQIVPLSYLDSKKPEKLWEFLRNYEKTTGGKVLAIPHNGNMSNGLMFSVEKSDGTPIDRAYAEERMKWEPLYEVTQTKGDSETHPVLSPEDEFADYYTWDKGNFGAALKTPEMLPHEYARSALKLGLEQEAELGINPFKFGLVGSTDSHTSLSTTREDNFFGKMAYNEPGKCVAGPSEDPANAGDVVSARENCQYARFDHNVITDNRDEGNNDGALTEQHWRIAASGLAAVWARENTRGALWDSMSRKEVYATTGTRIQVRVFAGWHYTAADLHKPRFAEVGYAGGVPMGGDLTAAPRGERPKFMVVAQKDPDGANLDRIQVIKGWLDKNGATHERIFDVAVSDGRHIGPDGRCPTPVGDTVNLKDASFANTIGAPILTTYWQDPTFKPTERAFYYVRVLEIPTPSWVARDEAFFKTEAPPEAVRKQQDRAYTSPIWYTPGTGRG